MNILYYIFASGASAISLARLKLTIVLIYFLLLSGCIHNVNSPPQQTNSDLTLEQLGEKSIAEKDFISAQAYYQQAVQNRPTISAYLGLATTLEFLEKWGHSAEVWYALSDIQGIDAAIKASYLTNASKNMIRAGQVDKAKEYLLTIEPSYRKARGAQSVAGLIYTLDGNEDAALTTFENILIKNPDDYATKTNLALAHLVFHNKNIALDILTSMPNSQSNTLNLAIALAFDQQSKAAFEMAKSVQTDEEAKATVLFAKNLIPKPPIERAYILFGITQ